MKKKVGIIITLAVLLIGFLLPTMYWDGAVPAKLQFHIVEASTHKPITGAAIRVSNDMQLRNLEDTNVLAKIPSATTDAQGRATIQILFGAGGTRSIFRKSGRYILRHELTVEAPGYRPLTSPLENVLGSSSFSISKREFNTELSLLKQR